MSYGNTTHSLTGQAWDTKPFLCIVIYVGVFPQGIKIKN